MDDTQPPGTPTIRIEPLAPLPPPPPGMAPQGNDDTGFPLGVRVRCDIFAAGLGEVTGTDWILVPPDGLGGYVQTEAIGNPVPLPSTHTVGALALFYYPTTLGAHDVTAHMAVVDKSGPRTVIDDDAFYVTAPIASVTKPVPPSSVKVAVDPQGVRRMQFGDPYKGRPGITLKVTAA